MPNKHAADAVKSAHWQKGGKHALLKLIRIRKLLLGAGPEHSLERTEENREADRRYVTRQQTAMVANVRVTKTASKTAMQQAPS
jgi:hypothetical protein